MWKHETSVKPSNAPSPPLVKATPTETRPVENIVMDLGKSVIIKGELSASEDLTLYGQMDGRVTLPNHTLTIGPHADIKAEISAKAVVIMGAVIGNVTARERVEIRATGSVTGDIRSPRLAVADGGYLHGRVEMTESSQVAVAGARPEGT
jgi:cytoskeletal protein CcmA (bactofilin family)